MKIEKLTESEELVMKAIWKGDKEPVLSDVVEVVTECYKKDWKPQTVSTFLAKLCNKRYLKLQRNGKIYTYKILVSQEKYNRQQLKNLCLFLYDGDIDAVREDLKNI